MSVGTFTVMWLILTARLGFSCATDFAATTNVARETTSCRRLSLPDSNLFSIASMVWSIGTFHFVNDFSRQMTVEEVRLRFQRFPGFRQVEQIPEGVRQSVKDH